MNDQNIGAAALLIAAGLVGCAGPGAEPLEGEKAAPGAEARADATYDALFLAAGAEHDVPPELLKALSFALTGYHMVVGEQEFPGQPTTFGLMALDAEMT